MVAEGAVQVAEESASMYDAVFEVLLNSQNHADRNQSAAAGERGAAETSLSSLESLASFSESNARSVKEQLNGTREVESSLTELGEAGEALVRLTTRINTTAARLQGEVENLDRLLDRLKV